MSTVDLPKESRHAGSPDPSSPDLASPAMRPDRNFLQCQKRNSLWVLRTKNQEPNRVRI
jgi:hypothetical protein